MYSYMLERNIPNLKLEDVLQPYPISDIQKERFIELILYCFPKLNDDDKYPFFREDNNGFISFGIHAENKIYNDVYWLDMLIQHVAPRVLKSSSYWKITFFGIAFSVGVSHPVDILYDKYKLLMNNESISKMTNENEDAEKPKATKSKRITKKDKVKEETKEETVFFE